MNHNVKEAANRVRMLRLKQCFTARENAEVTASMLADAETLADYVWDVATSPDPAPAHVGDAGILVEALEQAISVFRGCHKHASALLCSEALSAYVASVPPTAPDPERVRLLEEVKNLVADYLNPRSGMGYETFANGAIPIIKELEALNARN